ncbi:MAG TPA: glycosyl hydrolase, partial [Myxococcales bacterium]|nr:glycosyl hydrolase [Myxococcales bacterium]
QNWPKTLEDEPVFGNHQAETDFNYFHGYRHFDENDIEPLFPFGFGLSYTSFELSNLVLSDTKVNESDSLSVTVDVKNAGKRRGVEVVQLYASYPNTLVRRAKMELKGYARVELDADETKTVTIQLSVADLAYYDMEQKKWRVEALAHRIHVGRNARDLPLVGEVAVNAQ